VNVLLKRVAKLRYSENIVFYSIYNTENEHYASAVTT